MANLLAPWLAELVGWHNVLVLAMLPLALVLAAFLLMAKDSPSRPTGQPVACYLAVLKRCDLWLFGLFYSVTFGGYVGMSSFLPLFLWDQYGLSPVMAGYLTAVAAFVGSGLRPLGGYLADRCGGVRLLSLLFLGIAATYVLAAQLPTAGVMVGLLVASMACLGMGNDAVFQLVPQRFRLEIGIATGIVGALGGLGGFLLPNLLSIVKVRSGSFGPGFLVLAGIVFAALVLLRLLVLLHEGWRFSWRTPAYAGRVLMEPYLKT